MSTTAQQPTWYPVEKGKPESVLKIQNTLTRSKVEFIPKDERIVKWYNCGPTVYDHAHLGHARNYVSQDVIRRILTDYFNYDVFFVMNITDIDDKIIQSSRKKYLFKQFRDENPILSSNLLSNVREKWIIYFRKNLLPHLSPSESALEDGVQIESSWQTLVDKLQSDPQFKTECMRKSEKFDMYFTQLKNAYLAILQAQNALTSNTISPEEANKLVDASYDILTFSLDIELKDTVTSHIQSLSREHASFWEAKFMEDMKALRVRPPDLLTRVTEYVPEVVRFIDGIIQRGFAYEMSGSVYFDTQAFDGARNKSEKTPELHHWYLKLEPWSKGNSEKADEGEGALSSDNKLGKRHRNDFALWKSSKMGEPSWPSPWGDGRPGWHIECSVMASEVFGDNMDIHSGGEDLTFPHHDNELAQSEAYHDCHQWVNYFIHTGHLHIEGLKMSKSLKNFITVEDILRKYSARQLRLSFMTTLWNTKMDFQDGVMNGEVKSIETALNNFFTTVKALLSRDSGSGSMKVTNQHTYHSTERELAHFFSKSQQAFRAALCDSFNTPEALDIVMKLVSRTNIYINSQTSSAQELNTEILRNIASWITKMLRMFGLGEGPGDGGIGWGELRDQGQVAVADREEVIMPYLRALSSFRDSVRTLAMKKEVSAKELLILCDKLRDDELVPLGVALDDREDGRALIKLVSPDILVKARNEKLAQAEEKAAKKAANIAAEREKRRQQMEQGKMPPFEMFKGEKGEEFGSWDENGIPLTMADGQALSKSKAKSIKKDWDAQRKRHQEYLKWIESNPVS